MDKELVSKRLVELMHNVDAHPPEKRRVALLIGVSDLMVNADKVDLTQHLAAELKALGKSEAAAAHEAEQQSELTLAIKQRDDALAQVRKLTELLTPEQLSKLPAGA